MPLFYEWSRDYIKEFRLNRPAAWPEIRAVRPTASVDNPMDMEFGPDGALYVLEYGDGYFAENPDAQLAQINFVRGNHTPIVKVAATPRGGRAPLTVKFSSAGTSDPDGDPLAYAWDFDADGTVDSHRSQPDLHVHGKNGTYRPTLRVTDRPGARPRPRCRCSSATAAGGRADHVAERERPVPLRRHRTYKVTVTDDTPVDCTKVTVAYVLGHETHGHPQSSTAGCTGSITTFAGLRARRRGEPERRVRRLLHRPR